MRLGPEASITFTGTATDAQDGNLTAGLAWTSSLDGAIGSGGAFSRSDLSVGTHTITASVSDSGSLTGQAQVAITVTAALSGDLALATGNLLGGIAKQTLVLVLLDAVSRSRIPLSSLSKVLEPLIEALFVILLVSLALLGPLLPASAAIGSVSPVSILLAAAWLAGLFVIDRLSKDERWEAVAEHVAGAVVAPSPGPAPGVRERSLTRSSVRSRGWCLSECEPEEVSTKLKEVCHGKGFNTAFMSVVLVGVRGAVSFSNSYSSANDSGLPAA